MSLSGRTNTLEKRIFIPKQPLLTEVTDSYYRKQSVLPEIGLFYTFDAAKQHRIPLFFPDNTIDIMFSSREDGSDPHIGIYGQRLRPGTLDVIHPNYRYFGVRLSPGTRPGLLGMDLSELKEQNLTDADDFVRDRSLLERIIASQNFDDQCRIFTESFCRFQIEYRDSSQQNLFYFLQNLIIVSGGTVSVAQMAEQSGYSERYIKKIFTQKAAIGPKLFSRIIRFQNLIDQINRNVLTHKKTDFSRCAACLGFSDQPHMIREMKNLTGYTPLEYIHHLQRHHYEERLIRL